MHRYSPILLLPAVLILASCGKPQAPVSKVYDAWNPANDPLNLSSRYSRQFDRLPKQGQLQKRPWSDSYWPDNQFGIAARWNNSDPQPFAYISPTQDQVDEMSLAQIAQLSPAEKYDIYQGRFDYPTVAAVRSHTSPSDLDWEGICHGWAPIALIFDEPRPVVVEGASGHKIPFGSSDVKALLSFYQGQVAQPPTQFLGTRCEGDLDRPECKDVNAGSFHVVLTNQVGLMGKGFIADIERDKEVWNQPIHGYKVELGRTQGPSQGAAPGTVQEVNVTATVNYAAEIDPSWHPVLGTGAQSDIAEKFTYRLELNARGEVIGGEWTQESRPDFLWTQDRPRFQGYFANLERLYAQSVGSQRTPDLVPVATPPNGTEPPTAPDPSEPPPTPPVPVTPVVLGQIECPAGYTLKTLGTEGGQYCSNGTDVWGPFTEAMINKCFEWGGGASCRTDRWSESLALRARGTGRCPTGANLDDATGYCVEGINAFGPFPRSLVERCEAFGGGDSCSSARWNHSLLTSMLNQVESAASL